MKDSISFRRQANPAITGGIIGSTFDRKHEMFLAQLNHSITASPFSRRKKCPFSGARFLFQRSML
jgi:hypothetical protein